MGRRDAVAFTLEVAAEIRRLDPRIVIDFLPGWETRGNGQAANYEGGEVHHTASNSSARNPFPTKNILVNGRSDLPGPLCNWSGPWCDLNAPRLTVVAAHPANHAGASGGKNMGPLPVTGLFNPRVVGLEIDYAGSAPMTTGQYRAAVVWGRAVVNVLKRGADWLRGHAETSITGKWDPGYAPGKTIDLNAYRADVARLTTTPIPGGFLMALSDQQQDELYNWVKGTAVIVDNAFVPKPNEGAFPGGGTNAKGELTIRSRNTDATVASLSTRLTPEVIASTVVAKLPVGPDGTVSADSVESVVRRVLSEALSAGASAAAS